MEKIILNNGKEINVNIDYGNGLPYKKAIFPSYEYGDWQQDSSIALIKIPLSLEEINLFDIKKIQYKELHFVDSQFWFDLDEIYIVIHNNTYIYNHIYNKKFAIVIYDNSENEIVTLNFKTIYDNLPIEDKNGIIEQNIDKIYTECLEIAKNNNKEVLKDIINNETFKHDGLINSFNYDLKDSIKSQNNNIYEVIEKIKLDDGTEIDLKPALAPQVEYGDWKSDESIILIKANLDKEEYDIIKDKPIHYKETNFIEGDFWFDLESFHFVLPSNSYLYERIYHLKFIIVILNPEKEVIATLNFINN